MTEVLVIGHKNPDTDAICSAIGYAEFKRRTGMLNAVAARCGDTNDRIDFVLKSFQMAAPRFVADVSPKVRDVMTPSTFGLTPDATAAEALGIIDERNIPPKIRTASKKGDHQSSDPGSTESSGAPEDRHMRVLPVLNEDRTCRGLVSLLKMSRIFFPTPNRPFDSRRVFASVRNLARSLNGSVICASDPDKEEDLVLMIGAMSPESFSGRLATYPRERMIVIVGDRLNIQELAIHEKVRVVIVTGDLPIDPTIKHLAEANQVSLLLSPHDSATTAMLCRAAITVKHMIHEQFVSFQEDETLESAREVAISSRFLAFPVLDQQKKMVGILTKPDFLKRVDRQLILVDHNELSQAVPGAGLVEILEVIDHHRIGSLTTHQPILFRNEPVGSTSTIVADSFFRLGIDMPHHIAGLLLAGLVADTLNLSSPTATKRDAEILRKLEKLSGVNAAEFTDKLFASGSVLTSKPADQAITTDCKEYVELEKTFSVAQIEEIGFDQFWKRKAEVMDALEQFRVGHSYYFSALLVTDVVQQTSLLLLSGAKGFLQKIDYPQLELGIYRLESIVSRKKQLLPYLSHCLEKVKRE